MTSQYGRCLGVGPGSKTCTYLVKIGQTVTLAANDVDTRIYAAVNIFAADPPDPRTIQSQFVSSSAPCATPERGVCTFKVTGDQTVTAQFKSLSLTTVYFSGGPIYRFTVSAPPELLIQNPNPPTQNLVLTMQTPGVGPCIGLSPGKLCVYIRTPDNSTITMEALPVPGPVPMGSIGPTLFVGWGGACAINLTNPTCNLTSGIDQQVTMKWEYYRCLNGALVYPIAGVSFYKFPANDPILTSNQCVLVSS